jgi:hypothetical protein
MGAESRADHSESSAPVDLTADEYHAIICALAGNFPHRFGPIRLALLRKLTKAQKALAPDETEVDR